MKPGPAILIVAISVGLSVAVSTLVPPRLPPAQAAIDPAAGAPLPTLHPSAARLDGLEERVTALEAVLEQATARFPPSAARPEPAAPARAPARDAVPLRALEDRLASLERRVTAAVPPPARPKPPEPSVEQAKATILDAAASVEDKIEAHRRLRHAADAYSPAMVQELVRIATTHTDPVVRAKVWCFFDGSSKLPSLVPHLLTALAHDSDGGPRNEAAETLGNYADNPAVRQALEYAFTHDPDPRVRAKASRTVGRRDVLPEQLRQQLLERRQQAASGGR